MLFRSTSGDEADSSASPAGAESTEVPMGSAAAVTAVTVRAVRGVSSSTMHGLSSSASDGVVAPATRAMQLVTKRRSMSVQNHAHGYPQQMRLLFTTSPVTFATARSIGVRRNTPAPATAGTTASGCFDGATATAGFGNRCNKWRVGHMPLAPREGGRCPRAVLRHTRGIRHRVAIRRLLHQRRSIQHSADAARRRRSHATPSLETFQKDANNGDTSEQSCFINSRLSTDVNAMGGTKIG